MRTFECRGHGLAADADLGLGFLLRACRGLERTPVGRFHLMRVAPAEADAREAPIGTAPWSALRCVELIGLPQGNPIQKLIDQQLVSTKAGPIRTAPPSIFSAP